MGQAGERDKVKSPTPRVKRAEWRRGAGGVILGDQPEDDVQTRDGTDEAAFAVAPPQWPAADHSGAIGARLLRLLRGRGDEALAWLAAEQTAAGGEFAMPDTRGKHRWPLHVMYNGCTAAHLLAVLVRCGGADAMPAGRSRAALVAAVGTLLRAAVATHPQSGSGHERPDFWHEFSSLRMLYLIGLPAWVLWDELDDATRARLPRVMAWEADRWLDRPAPAQLFDDTQAESNAWTGGGLAVVAAMLRTHPHRDAWETKARELMISAYATPDDVASDRVVDGRPLRDWLRGANAFPDGAVENHGLVHPDYIAAVSEMVRSAIAYRLAGAPCPAAATFGADRVLKLLLRMNLPDGNHLYVQGSDYHPEWGSRRLDSFFQASSVVALRPDPLLQACFLRCLDSVEAMVRERPAISASGILGLPYDFGLTWGLCEHYLLRRFHGDGGPALPDAAVNARLAGVHCNEAGRFVIHRTATKLTSCSWHAGRTDANLAALTMPLSRDVRCSPYPLRGYFGRVVEAGRDPAPPALVWQRVQPRADGFGVMLGLTWCGGAVSQRCAFVSLPTGASVYLEERTALRDVTLSVALSGTVAIYDDTRWPLQPAPRVFADSAGQFAPGAAARPAGPWFNVDDCLGYATLGADHWALTLGRDRWRTWELGLDALAGAAGSVPAPRALTAGTTVDRLALVTAPGATAAQTATLAADLHAAGWVIADVGALAVRVGTFLVFAVFGPAHQRLSLAGRWVELAPHSVGWLDLADPRANLFL